MDTDHPNLLNHRSLLEAARHIRLNLLGNRSIDQFIHDNQGDHFIHDVGKYAISYCICAAEHESRIPNIDQNDFSTHNDTWLARCANLIFSGMPAGIDGARHALNQVGIICFNYDRCIEVHFERVLKREFGLLEEEAISLIDNMDIVHPYGKIGPLRFYPVRDVAQPPVPFGDTEGLTGIWPTMIGQVKTFTESINGRWARDKLRSLLASAEHIMFLGFSYGEENMEKLRLFGGISPQTVHGSVFNMSSVDVEEASHGVRSLFNAQRNKRYPSEAHFIPLDMTCNQVMAAYAELTSFGS